MSNPPKPGALEAADAQDRSRTRLSMPPPAPAIPLFGSADSLEDLDLPADVVTRIELAKKRLETSENASSSGVRQRPTWVSQMLRQQSPSSSRRVQIAHGKQIDGTRFEVVRWLGDGGMGVVYEARQIDLDRRVALKVLRSEVCADSRVLEQFRGEARAASRIGSKYIVQIYDFDALADGRLLLAMELLEGSNLQRVINDASPLEPGRCIAILRQMCKGLAAAHEAGIVHRDIKPDNIFLSTVDGRADAVKILDFGIAAVVEQGVAIASRAAGTPDYLAPEVVAGASFDARVDIYALGCTAYAMVTGKPPFGSESIRETLLAHLEKDAIPPSSLVGPERCPAGLEAVVMRCLAKQPGDRYSDMSDVEAALCEAQIGDGVQSLWDDLPLPEVDPDRREKLLREMPDASRPVERPRSRWVLATALAGLVAVAGLVGYELRDEPTPTVAAAEDGQIERLMNQARAAGARSHYVYPPLETPKTPTSYIHVLQLERVEGTTRPIASDAARTLRNEFADTLTRLGNKYWDVPEARSFAMDYYVQALMFDPDQEQARDRAVISPGELSNLRSRAARADFSETELLAVTPLAVLAEPDEQERERKLARWFEDDARARAPVTRDRASVVGDLARGRKRQPEAETTGPALADDVGPGVVAEDAEPGASDEPGARTTGDPTKARELAKDGQAALAAGKTTQAERLFQKALGYDRRSAQALIGLSDIAFNRGKYPQAADYAGRAVGAAPRNASYRVKLGDAYYKVLHYEKARGAYKRAIELGAKDAKGRLQRVEEKLGR